MNANTLTYHKETDTHYFSITDSSTPKNSDGEILEEHLLCLWLGNGDTRYKPVSELGEIVDEFDSYESAEPKLNKLINSNLVSGVDG